MRRVTAVIFIFLLLLALPVSASAAEDAGSTIITGAIPGEHIFTLEPVENARVVLNGAAISGTLVLPRHSEMNLAIIPDPGYEIDQVFLNGEDVTGQVSGGFLTIPKLYEDTVMQVTTKPAGQTNPGRKTYLCDGRVLLDGVPVRGATVQIPGIGGDITGRDGSFRIRRIPAGDWSFAVTRDGKLLGYIPFTLQVGPRASCVAGPDGSYIITVPRGALVEGFSITLDLSQDTKVELERFKVKELDASTDAGATNPQTGDYIMVAVAVLIVSGILLALAWKKKDSYLDEEKPQ